MKVVLKHALVIVLIMLPLTVVMGQRGPKGPGNGQQQQLRDGSRLTMLIPDLTDEQKEKIQELHLNMMKESLDIRNQLNEKRAKLQTLRTSENPDMDAINKLIDESAELQADLRKKAAANHQEVRALLTEEQRLLFDSGRGRHGNRLGRPGRAGRDDFRYGRGFRQGWNHK